MPFYTAARVSLFLTFLQSVSTILVCHHRHRLVDWHIAPPLAAPVGGSPFLGGFISKGIRRRI